MLLALGGCVAPRSLHCPGSVTLKILSQPETVPGNVPETVPGNVPGTGTETVPGNVPETVPWNAPETLPGIVRVETLI